MQVINRNMWCVLSWEGTVSEHDYKRPDLNDVQPILEGWKGPGGLCRQDRLGEGNSMCKIYSREESVLKLKRNQIFLFRFYLHIFNCLITITLVSKGKWTVISWPSTMCQALFLMLCISKWISYEALIFWRLISKLIIFPFLHASFEIYYISEQQLPSTQLCKFQS